MATLVAAYTSTTTTCPSRRPSQLSHNHHHHPRRYSNNNTATTFSSNPAEVLAIPFSTMSKDSITTTGTMKSETDDSSNPQEQEEQPQIRTVKKSALKSSIKRQQQQDQREDSSCDDGNSIATPTGSLPQPRAVRFSPGVSSTTTGTSLEEYATLPDLPPSSYGGTRQPLGRKARQAQVRKLLHLASQRDSESGSLVPIPSKDSQLS